MQTQTKTIIYDECCPLCSAYTNAFVAIGLINENARKNFSNISPQLMSLIDNRRSANEIPVIDEYTNEVWYGIDALLEILGQRFPLIKKYGNIKPVKWMLIKLYKFISFNRRVIVAKNQATCSNDCTPDFNVRYRVFFMLLFLVFNTCMLVPIQQYLLTESMFTATTIQQLQCAHATIVTLNILIAASIGKKAGIEYLGQVNMLALLCILLTIPLIIINKYAPATSFINNFFLGVISLVIIKEYMRRMKFAGIFKTNLWIAYINGSSVLIMLLILLKK